MKTNLLAVALCSLATLVHAEPPPPLVPVDLDHWIPRNPGTNADDFHLTAIAYGSGTFVAVGSQGPDSVASIVTSPDGAAWTRQNDFASAFPSGLSDITYGGGKFVAVGSLDHAALLLTSSDGKEWSQSSSNISGAPVSVTYGNGTFVAVGSVWSENDGQYFASILTSPDGTTWTEQHRVASNAYLRCVAYGNGLFVAGGAEYVAPDRHAIILTSPDGSTWASQSVGTNTTYGPDKIAYGNGVFVAVGVRRFMGFSIVTGMTSPDGITWSTSFGGRFIYSVFFANGTFVAVGGDCNEGGCVSAIHTSPDGVTWTRRYYASDSSGSYRYLQAIGFGNGSFVAVGSGGMILQSGTGVQFNSTASVRFGDGTMRLVLGAQTGAVLELEASTNLVDWIPLATLTNTLGTVDFLDQTATSFNRRFYRARQVSPQ